jgi:hypothetical protein
MSGARSGSVELDRRETGSLDPLLDHCGQGLEKPGHHVLTGPPVAAVKRKPIPAMIIIRESALDHAT